MLGPALRRLSALAGAPIEVTFRPELTAWRGLLNSSRGSGVPVHAGSDVRRRVMTLDSSLLRAPGELARVFVHEAHHFAWLRLGNARRRAFERLVAGEQPARGELGWSAEVRKARLTDEDRTNRSRRWREYLCESFCDTAAWMHSALDRHGEWTLGGRFRRKRAACMRELLDGREVPV